MHLEACAHKHCYDEKNWKNGDDYYYRERNIVAENSDSGFVAEVVLAGRENFGETLLRLALVDERSSTFGGEGGKGFSPSMAREYLKRLTRVKKIFKGE